MNKNEIIQKLKKHELELRRKDIVHAAVFGSYAREQQNINSDIDILVELDPNYEMSIFSYVGLKDYIKTLFDFSVDVVNKEALKKELRTIIEKEAIYAF